MFARILHHSCFLLLAAVFFVPTTTDAQTNSVAREWNELCLHAIRLDFPAPTVHARNLYHLSAAMWDAWAAYDPNAKGIFYNPSEVVIAANIDAARNEAVSYAAFRVLNNRYGIAIGSTTSLQTFQNLMIQRGYDPMFTSTDGNTPAALGNDVAATILAAAAGDGSNQVNLYTDPVGYSPRNNPLILRFSGTTMFDPNRWQPLAFNVAFTQNGQIASQIQTFIGSHWGDVTPFAITRQAGETTYFDPGAPPQLGVPGIPGDDAAYQQANVEVIQYSNYLDPDANRFINISPGARGNNTLGTNDGNGYPVNEETSAPYAPNVVNHADYGRVVAEFWADGPESETPPGHWNVIANEIADDPRLEKRIARGGPLLGPLEWDVKIYLALNAALHDAAIAAWDNKVVYDYVRPISSIRHLGGLGQSSDPNAPSYNPLGLPLVPDLIELVTTATASSGGKHAHLGSFNVNRIAIFAWGGEPTNPATEYTGNAWILAADWLPYQRDTFVTPAFAGFVSGHSTFSRAAAEVLTILTGSPYFPGGLAEHTTPVGALAFESGPSADVTLQWATYYDAADEAGLSRIYGGIHVAPDDVDGRVIGSKVGILAANTALNYFNNFDLLIEPVNLSQVRVVCPTIPGFRYKLESSADIDWTNPIDLTDFTTATGFELENVVDASPERRFYRVSREVPER